MKNKEIIKQEKRQRRAARTRSKIKGTKEVPRACVYRSLKYISVQFIDDTAGHTIYSLSDKKLKLKGTKTERAAAVGEQAAEELKKLKISKIVFDRGPYKYHGRVKALADGLRKGGLKF